MKTSVTITLTLVLLASAQAESLVFETRAGVLIPVPAGFVQVPKSGYPITNARAANAVEGIFNATRGEAVVSLVVMNLPNRDTRQLLSELPSESGPAPRHLANEVVAGMVEVAPDARRNPETVPLLYDNGRTAYGVELRSLGPSLADLMLQEPDDSPDWREVKKAGADPALVRCLVSSISNALKAGNRLGVAEIAARRCKVTEAAAANYLKEVGDGLFQPRKVIERLLTVTTNRGVTLVKLDTDEAGRELLDSAWTSVWTGFRLLPDATPARGITSRLSFSSYSTSSLIGDGVGAIIGAILFGTLLGMLFLRLGAKPILAALLGQLTLVVIAFLLTHDEIRDRSITGMGLIRLAATLVAFPITFLSLRRRSLKKVLAKSADGRAASPKAPPPVQAIRAALEHAFKVESSDAEIMKNAIAWGFKRHSEADQRLSKEKFLAFLEATKAELEPLDRDTVIKPSTILGKYDGFLETVPIGSLGYEACRDAADKFLKTLDLPPETVNEIEQKWKEEDSQRFLQVYAEMKRTALQAVRIDVREKIEAAKAMGLDVSMEEAALKQLEG